MTTTRAHHTDTDADREGHRRHAPLPPFRTPVRGHAFAPRPPEAADPEPGETGQLVPEPGNPADPHAVAVWLGEEGRRWRIGYLDRGVAARVSPRLRDGMVLRVRMDGWTREPEGRWQRPLVLLEGEEADRPAPSARAPHTVQAREDAPAYGAGGAAPAPAPRGVWGRPPGVARRTLGPAVRRRA